MALQTVTVSIRGSVSVVERIEADATAAIPLFAKLKLVLRSAEERKPVRAGASLPRAVQPTVKATFSARQGAQADPVGGSQLSNPGAFQNRLIHGDCLTVMRRLPAGSADCVITSPPYWGLRDYGVEGQVGLEKTPEEFVRRLVEVFREANRVLKNEGTLWLNLGDSYVGGGRAGTGKHAYGGLEKGRSDCGLVYAPPTGKVPGLKPKDLAGIPWRVAFALQADGWYLRQDIIWSKPNPMPESVSDRCTKSHEYVFLLAKRPHYYFDNEAVWEPAAASSVKRIEYGLDQTHPANVGVAVPPQHTGKMGKRWLRWKENSVNQESVHVYDDATKTSGSQDDPLHATKSQRTMATGAFRNRRSVWTVTTKPFKGAHFATFPEDLIVTMVLAGCPKGGLVLDPFMGAGTTAVVAKRLGRNYLGIELNREYIRIAEQRIGNWPPP